MALTQIMNQSSIIQYDNEDMKKYIILITIDIKTNNSHNHHVKCRTCWCFGAWAVESRAFLGLCLVAILSLIISHYGQTAEPINIVVLDVSCFSYWCTEHIFENLKYIFVIQHLHGHMIEVVPLERPGVRFSKTLKSS